ncbi:MAG: hypothetical protein IT186_07385 [Acidobacteria bacterium]|nr:hypothetical protein [Acidobacteriota bacterium]MCG3192873.1 hypothetical protein [Thermoanaerobaculia bacterium]
MNDKEITALLSAASASSARQGWRCPDETQLADYVEGRLERSLREGVEVHLADCAFCRGQVGFLARAGRLEAPPAVPVHLLAEAKGDRSPLIRFLRPATLALAGAGFVIALFLIAPYPREGSSPGGSRPETILPSESRSGGNARNGRGAADGPWIVRPLEGQDLRRGALTLQWETAPAALFYTVQLVDQKGDVVWEGRSEGQSLVVPPDAALAPGQPYFAWVLAHVQNGATVRSPAVGFRVAPD